MSQRLRKILSLEEVHLRVGAARERLQGRRRRGGGIPSERPGSGVVSGGRTARWEGMRKAGCGGGERLREDDRRARESGGVRRGWPRRSKRPDEGQYYWPPLRGRESSRSSFMWSVTVHSSPHAHPLAATRRSHPSLVWRGLTLPALENGGDKGGTAARTILG